MQEERQREGNGKRGKEKNQKEERERIGYHMIWKLEIERDCVERSSKKSLSPGFKTFIVRFLIITLMVKFSMKRC